MPGLETCSSDDHESISRRRNGVSIHSDALNVIIPIGGIGSRFQKEGYRFPKPLINIVGRPMLCWLIDRLDLAQQDTIWIAVNEAIDAEFQVGQLMKKSFPKLDIRCLRLKYLTRGATETLFIVTQSIPVDMRGRRTISLDCDTIYFTNVLAAARALPPTHGGCVYFEDTGSEPIFSYIRTNKSNMIVELQEKKAISTKANTGAYIFPSGETLRKWASKVLDARLNGKGKNRPGDEYYTSHLIAEMLEEVPFEAISISTSDFSCVGTPKQLQQFLKRVKQDPSLATKKRRFCFDLDSTLVGIPEIPGDYSTCPPIWKNIELVRELHTAGHHIIIQTARRMRTHNGNVGSVVADIGLGTFRSLEKYGIPYDEVFFGKPWAHVYVDDLAVNANLDTLRETGWLVESDEKDNTDEKTAQKAGIVASRSFNHVQIRGQQIIKSSQSNHILGEMYFYANIPNQIADMFPPVYAIDYMAETTTYSITMERLSGTPYCHFLYGRALTQGRLHAFLLALHRIHVSLPASSANVPNHSEHLQAIFDEAKSRPRRSANIYANYSTKVRSRFTTFNKDFVAVDPEIAAIFNDVTARLDNYEAGGRGQYCHVIHGDPVFSNAILSESEKVYFFDIRSQLGKDLTTEGDLAYDLAKVFQSLNGYDLALLSSSASGGKWTFNPEDVKLLEDLQEYFWDWVDSTYAGRVEKQDVVDITASLLFSLIPLHKAGLRPVFLEMCKNVLKTGKGWGGSLGEY